MFTLYTVYHIVLLAELVENHAEANILTRITGIIIVMAISIASWLAFVPKSEYRLARMIIMCSALSISFVLRLKNAEGIIKLLDLNDTAKLLNCAVYILSQIALLLLLSYYATYRHKIIKPKRKRKISLPITVIILEALCLIMEAVLILHYNLKIDLSIKYTLISKFLYYGGYIALTVSFMQPKEKLKPKTKPQPKPTKPLSKNADIVF